MTVCRGDGHSVAIAALTLALVVATPAAAQLGPPIRLGPSSGGSGGDSGTSGAAGATGAPDNPLLAPVPRSDPPVERAPAPPLAAATPDAPGGPPPTGAQTTAPQPETGPGPIAPDETAQDTARSPLEPILAQLPLRIASPAARTLVVRALTIGGSAPGVRAARLLAMGDVANAAALAQRGPAGDEALQRVRLDLLLLSDDAAAACPLARTQVASTATPFWQRALIYCQLRDNQNDLAELGLSMLPEAGPQDDTAADQAAFVQLALAMAARQRATIDIVREPSPLLVAMLRATRQPLQAATLDTASPAILGSLARAAGPPGAGAGAALRLAAADRAEALGALDTRTLLQVYDGVSFSARESTNLAEVAEGDRGPRGRAALHRIVKAAGDDDARAVALQLLWRMGRERGFTAQAVRIGLAATLATTPNARLAAFAPDATRALLLAGNTAAAQRWAAVAGGDDAGQQAGALLWPLLRAAGEPQTRPLDDGIEAWRRAASARDAGFARTRLDVVRTILAASDALGAAGTRRAGARVAGEMASESEALASLAAAAAAGRRAETALHAARILVAAPGANAIAAAIRALGSVGLVAEARAVAVEALLTAGL
jgi:hypothetical protein